MKKQFKLFAAALVLSLTAFTVNAQNAFKKSDKIVEGTVSYSKASGADASYSFNPSVGYFVTDRFAVGVAAGLGKDENGVKATSVGAYGRCYFFTSETILRHTHN